MNKADKRAIILYFNDGGYVLNFNNNSFAKFIYDTLGFDPYIKYGDMSKGKLLTAMYDNEDDVNLSKLTSELLVETETLKKIEEEKLDFIDDIEETQIRKRISEYDKKINKVKEVFQNYSEEMKLDIFIDKSLYTNLNELKEDVENYFKSQRYLNGLDRLHTLFHGYLIQRSNSLNIPFLNPKGHREPLNVIYNKIVKYLINTKKIKSEVTIDVLNNSKVIIESFNDSRNKFSKSHPSEQWLNEHEARYINAIVISTITLLDSILKPTTQLMNFQDKE